MRPCEVPHSRMRSAFGSTVMQSTLMPAQGSRWPARDFEVREAFLWFRFVAVKCWERGGEWGGGKMRHSV